ncbi:two-component system regulatory protein YycI [Secundilactobacillus hailunensis]|uniref:Two-component system regulatory protein YycI n=1 Tax=Secundilactobacillus hailunensis TaxID=2559923 RepID=A0ABW1TA44_9LACO|nr:two-component system regulatory protein YycI [Secundilactobacillus hailunensis]
MNFKRIQWIFLVIFIAMDVLLFMMFNHSNVGDSTATGNNNILEEMHKDQITFSTPTTKKYEGYYFSGNNDDSLRQDAPKLQEQDVRFSGNELVSEFKTPIKLTNGSAKQTLDKIITNPGLIAEGQQYSYSKQLSSSSEVIYVQHVAQKPVYSHFGQIRFDLNSQHQVVGYSQNYLSNVKILKEETKTISEERALTWLYQYNEIPNGAKVSWVHLAYTRLLTARGQCVFLPTWVFAVKLNNSSSIILKRVNAYTGEVIKTGDNNQTSNANSEIFTLT